MKRFFLSFILYLFSALFCSAHASEKVYMSEKEALQWAFPDSSEVREKTVDLNEEQAAKIEAATGGKVYESDKKIYIGKSGDKTDGIAVITNEIGKFELITFIVKMTPNRAVEKVAVLVYRESRGGEIVRKRFLHQYRGKSKNSDLKINRDIINITGATMSVRAMNRGIRKVLKIVNENL